MDKICYLYFSGDFFCFDGLESLQWKKCVYAHLERLFHYGKHGNVGLFHVQVESHCPLSIVDSHRTFILWAGNCLYIGHMLFVECCGSWILGATTKRTTFYEASASILLQHIFASVGNWLCGFLATQYGNDGNASGVSRSPSVHQSIVWNSFLLCSLYRRRLSKKAKTMRRK